VRRILTFRLVLLLTASLPLESVYAVPGSESITKLVGILAAGAWASAVLASGRMRAPHALHVVALLFVLWNACSLLWTVDGPATQTRVLTYAQLFVLLLVVWETVTTATALRKVLLADLVGCCVAAVTMVVGYVIQGTGAEVHGRVTVGSFNANDAGVILALGLPVACFLLASPWPGPGRRPVVLLAATYLPLGVFAVLATGSRAALAAVVPAVWYAGRLLGRSRPVLAVATFAGIGVLAVAALPLLPTRAMDRLGETGHDLAQGNLNERQDVWAEAIRIIHDHPWGGAGAGAFRTAATGVNKVGHNFVLALLAEVGVVGLALFVLMIVVALRALRPAPKALRELWFTFFAAWTFAALLHNWEYRKLTWLMFGLMAACGALRRSSAEDRRSGVEMVDSSERK
jgi:O-antigen ligase